MSNFIFISPNFPTNYWQFCRELKNDGMNVLGIGDQPYDELKPELKDSLNEYYKVGSLENYDEVYRAVAFFAFKYGRIDWLESNNEYWLERDAALRTDFNIKSGFQTEDMPRIKYKSKMKEYYQKAGIATARYHMVDDLESCRKFIKEVGYPVVVKPDNGVGASDTHKLSSDEELKRFLLYKSTYHPDLSYIMEEFVHAEVNSYDAIIDGSGRKIFQGFITGLAEGVGLREDATAENTSISDSKYVKIIGMTVNDSKRMTFKVAESDYGYGTGSYYVANDSTRPMFFYYAVLYGDLNGDTRIDGTDKSMLDWYLNGNTSFLDQSQLEAADVDHSGSVDSIDASMIKDFYTLVNPDGITQLAE